jgi:hypothetical protein
MQIRSCDEIPIVFRAEQPAADASRRLTVTASRPPGPNDPRYWTPQTGAHEVHGAIRDLWASMGWEQSWLGYPISDEQDAPGGGRISYFQGGSISWTPQGGAVVHPR